MRAILFELGPIRIHGYGLMIAIGVVLAFMIAEKRAPKKGLDADSIWSLGIWCAVGGFLGAKLLYVITEWKSLFAGNLTLKDILYGFVVYGGIIGGILAGYLYCRAKKMKFLKYFDIVMPSIALAQGFGRIGCFLSGCCYGMESSFGFVIHGNTLIPEINDVRRLPVPLIEAVCNLVIFFILLRLFKKGKENGKMIFYYMLIYPVVRFVLEFFRGDAIRGFLFGLSTSQWISIGLFVVAVWKLFLSKSGGKKTAVCAGVLLAMTLAFGGVTTVAYATEESRQETEVTTTGTEEKEPPFNAKEKFVIFICCFFSVALCLVIALFGNPKDREKDKYNRMLKQKMLQEKKLREKAEREARFAAEDAKYAEDLIKYERAKREYEEAKAAKKVAKEAKKATKN